ATTYHFAVEAFDADGNSSNRALLDATTSYCNPPAGLVAAYGFDESSGSTAGDASGNGHSGALLNTTWTTTGRDGGALSFNGTNASVDLGQLGTFYKTGFTLEAWMNTASAKNDVGILGTWNG